MADSISLQLLMGPTIAVPVPADLSNALQSAQVTTAVGSPSGVQLTFAVSKNSVITNSLLPFGFFDPKIRVILMVIFNGTPHVLMDGIITKHDMSPSNDPRQSTFTVTGEDLTKLMKYEQKTVPWSGLPAPAQVAAICATYAPYGIAPVTVPPVLAFMPSANQQQDVQTSISDLDYITKLASNNGYTFYITPGPAPGTNIAYWGPEVRAGAPQPALTVNSDAASNVDSLSFSVDGNSSTAFTASVRVPFVHLYVDVPIPDVSLVKLPLAARPVAPLTKRRLPNVATLDLVQAMLVGLDRTQATTDAVTAQGKLDVLRYGSILTARSIVGVRGAGLAHDGLYYVRSVTHDLKRGQFTQSFSLSRDGLGPITPRVMT
ncbi:MAG TPA: hypothetical protein VGM75_09885 [Pseudonocardiaceae bacterium]